MKLFQYNIPLPLSYEEISIAEEFVTLMTEMDIFKNGQEKINYILPKEFNNAEYVGKYLEIEEEKILAFQKNKILINVFISQKIILIPKKIICFC